MSKPHKSTKPPLDRRAVAALATIKALERADVKALSWALRALVPWDRASVVAFLDRHDGGLAARIKREVRHKLRTGVKAPRRLPTRLTAQSAGQPR